MTRKLRAKLPAEMKAVIEDLRAAIRPINPTSAAANIDRWLTAPELQPPVAPPETGTEDKGA